MRIATWNVNSIRVRIQQVLNFLKNYDVDILMMQEIKCTNKIFPSNIFENNGFNCAVYGQKTYNGVAIVSKYIIEDVNTGNSIFKKDQSARYIDAFINGFRIVCVYVPNGQEVNTQYYFYKLEFLDKLIKHLSNVANVEDAIIGGDFNIARSDLDVWNVKLWRGRNCCSNAEREKFQRLLDIGFKDVLRENSDDRELFTWWDYRHDGFKSNHGLRLDYLLASKNINVLSRQRCIKMRSLPQPSDHAPILIEI